MWTGNSGGTGPANSVTGEDLVKRPQREVFYCWRRVISDLAAEGSACGCFDFDIVWIQFPIKAKSIKSDYTIF